MSFLGKVTQIEILSNFHPYFMTVAIFGRVEALTISGPRSCGPGLGKPGPDRSVSPAFWKVLSDNLPHSYAKICSLP